MKKLIQRFKRELSIPCAVTICVFEQVCLDAMQGAGRAAVLVHCRRAATKQRARQTPGKSANGDRVKYIISLVFSLAFVSICSHAADNSPVGTWKTIDDKTNQAKSLVKITETNGELQGVVEKIFSPPAKVPDPLCIECKGDKKDKPIVGMMILSGLRKNGDEYSGGTILDPANGKTYKCKIKLSEDGSSLEVRGFIGISLLGRTQVWVRE